MEQEKDTEMEETNKGHGSAAEAAEARRDPELARKTAEGVPDAVAAAGEPQARKTDKKTKRKNRRKKWLGRIVLLLILLAAAAAFFLYRGKKNAAAEQTVDPKNVGTVMRGDITNELTSSGSLSAKDTYTITSLVEGEIIEADFEEGDQVEKGQVLYRIDPSDMDREIENAQKSVGYAEDDLKDAQEEYSRAAGDLNGGMFVAPSAGYIRNLSLKAGDTVGQNTEIAELYNDTTMKLRLPFLTADADAIPVGAQMIVTLTDTGEQLPGQVLEKSSMEETLTGGTLVKYLTLIVENPGGLTTSDSASAQSGDFVSAASGTFEAYTSNKLKYDLSQSVKVASVLVHEGDYVTAGTPVFTMTSESYEEALRQTEKAVEQAEQQLDTAQSALEQQQEKLDDYTITAPISGQVISKTGKVGDKISRSSDAGSNTLAIIYDLSELTFEMSIDELDISKVAVGQMVEIAADAFDDQTYTGHVTNVSLNGSYSNGVTTYPVTVTLDDQENLLPSMNVDGTIILERAEDVLYIPTNALQRGNIVYVKAESLTEEQKAAAAQENADGEGSSRDAGGEGPAAEAKEPGSEAAAAPAGESGAGSPDGAPAEGTAEGRGAGTMPRRGDIPEGFTAVRVETGLTSDDYVEITSGLSEGQEVYVKDSESTGGFFMGGFGGGPGGGMGGPGGGGPGGGGPGGPG